MATKYLNFPFNMKKTVTKGIAVLRFCDTEVSEFFGVSVFVIRRGLSFRDTEGSEFFGIRRLVFEF